MPETSTPGNSTLATLAAIQFTLKFIGGTAHWLNRHRDSLEVIQDFPLITDQEYSGHYRRKSERYMLRYISISREKYNRYSILFTRTLVINW